MVPLSIKGCGFSGLHLVSFSTASYSVSFDQATHYACSFTVINGLNTTLGF
jgi:hypothetical protein